MPVGIGGNYGYQSPFWNPGAYRPPSGFDYSGTDWGLGMLEKSPQTAVYRYFRNLGAPVDAETPFAKWLQGQYGNILSGYQAATVDNPMTMNIRSYLGTLPDMSEWQRRYQMQAPAVRGLNYGAYGAGPARWVG
jgi:hypothetical protein